MAFVAAAAIAAGAAGASAVFGIGNGISQKIKANRLEKNNIRPIDKVNNNFLQNTAQAEQMARGGLASRVYNNAMGGLDTGLTAGLRQIGRSGGVGSIASTLRAYGAGVNNLNAQDQAAQLQNQRLLMQQRGMLGQEQQRVFQFNKVNPFMERAQQVASLRNAGNQNIFGGIQALGNVAGAFAGGGAAATNPAEAATGSPNFGGMGRNMGNGTFGNTPNIPYRYAPPPSYLNQGYTQPKFNF